MRTLFCCLFAAVCAAGTPPASSHDPAHGSPNSVTVLLSYEHPYSPAAFRALERQLRHTLSTVGLIPVVRERYSVGIHEQFSQLFLFTMKGSCDMTESLPIGALSDERGPLAMAYSSDGAILPFGEVECDRIRSSLERVVGHSSPLLYQSAFGNALGLVVAHELYHMISHSPDHTRSGVTKESLSAREMLSGSLSLPAIARMAIQDSGALH